jgi:hypothetical protein
MKQSNIQMRQTYMFECHIHKKVVNSLAHEQTPIKDKKIHSLRKPPAETWRQVRRIWRWQRKLETNRGLCELTKYDSAWVTPLRDQQA